MNKKTILSLVFLLAVSINFFINQPSNTPNQIQQTQTNIDKNGVYTSKKEVASYVFYYKHLPNNYITKKEALKLGWQANKGNLWEVAKGKSIGGDVFRNFERKLPEAKGRIWREADIDYKGGKRSAKRIVFSNDGLIFYTADHYESFEQVKNEK
ncbi:ribonuclease domain-containing protein [Campylobacter sp. 7477a]|uniref:ribonuclease domain-containing protein n=1 Tax=Campylobacter sp. 7477a TaxID=2735741 RepID=UPI003014520F|nr:ribonuclease [Campylobacter sp. 7477a]